MRSKHLPSTYFLDRVYDSNYMSIVDICLLCQRLLGVKQDDFMIHAPDLVSRLIDLEHDRQRKQRRNNNNTRVHPFW